MVGYERLLYVRRCVVLVVPQFCGLLGEIWLTNFLGGEPLSLSCLGLILNSRPRIELEAFSRVGMWVGTGRFNQQLLLLSLSYIFLVVITKSLHFPQILHIFVLCYQAVVGTIISSSGFLFFFCFSFFSLDNPHCVTIFVATNNPLSLLPPFFLVFFRIRIACSLTSRYSA